MSPSPPSQLTEMLFIDPEVLVLIFFFNAISTSGPRKVVGPQGNAHGGSGFPQGTLQKNLEYSPLLENVYLGFCEGRTVGNSWSQPSWARPKDYFSVFPLAGQD